ncbi:hypothetical protein B0H63DRAFT_471792 [Podospora didyma]|uniref:Uncharacterized protein n=1 Tax=Podospora didyma TaxID=330526 RepID=A0AAE0NP18_9PEZI|nr:hypothetical protein B0H63DRAFT_471792 [Podospora didyma]
MLFSKTTILTAVFASLHLAGAAPLAKRTNGEFTWYDIGLGPCVHVHTDADLVVSMNVKDFDPLTPNGNPSNNPLCGRTIRASHDGRNVDVTVVDSCGGLRQRRSRLEPRGLQGPQQRRPHHRPLPWHLGLGSIKLDATTGRYRVRKRRRHSLAGLGHFGHLEANHLQLATLESRRIVISHILLPGYEEMKIWERGAISLVVYILSSLLGGQSQD